MEKRNYAGLAALIEKYKLNTPLPATRSAIVEGTRKTELKDGEVAEFYPKSYSPSNTYEHIKFALRYEPINLSVYKTLFEKLEKEQVTEYIKSEPTGIYARKLWYLYELLTGEKLAVSDVPRTGYVDLANDKFQITADAEKSKRHYINDNLTGNAFYCPLIRKTEKVKKLLGADLKTRVNSVIKSVDPAILARAVRFLYTKETKSSFAIEGERVGKTRAERFVRALRRAAEFDVYSKKAFIELQNLIAEPRYAEKDWRNVQNFIGQTTSDYREQVFFVCPKPEDVEDLMRSWMKFIERVEKSSNEEFNPVVLAAAAAFGFVFIHPFEDGNGRIHRFLIHHFLSRAGFTQPGILFPVSAVMLRKRYEYDACLETFSASVMPFVEYRMSSEGFLKVENDTNDLYRFPDMTLFAEYLYDCITETIEIDLEEEIGFLQKFDEALERIGEIVDMPDRKASLLVRLLMQNKGILSKSKREKFAEISDEELSLIEKAFLEMID